MRKIIKLLRLPFADLLLFVRAALWITGVRVALGMFPFQKVRHFLARRSIPAANPAPARVPKIIWAVEISSHYLLPERPCLTTALVAQMFLSRQDYATTLRIGVAQTPNQKLQAHAWLEHDGRIIVGHLHDLERFTPLPPLGVDTL